MYVFLRFAAAANNSLRHLRIRIIIGFQECEDDDFLPYVLTEVNLTTACLSRSSRVQHSSTYNVPSHVFNVIYDALMTLYEAAIIHYRLYGNCTWSNNQAIQQVLSQVFGTTYVARKVYHKDFGISAKQWEIDVMMLPLLPLLWLA